MGDPGRSKGPAFRLRDRRRDAGATLNTPEMATRLAKYFGTSEQFWLNLRDAFAVHQVKEKLHKELRAVKPFAAAR
jgi:plasmid maintenance system antidote protein VapI